MGEGVVQWEVIGNAFPAIVHTRPAQQLTRLFKYILYSTHTCSFQPSTSQLKGISSHDGFLYQYIFVFARHTSTIYIGRLSLYFNEETDRSFRIISKQLSAVVNFSNALFYYDILSQIL